MTARHLWPREHGATAQLLFPLAGVPIVAGAVGWRWALFALAALAAFAAHEPLLVTVGRRGDRRRAELGTRARWALASLLAVAIVAAASALIGAGEGAWIALLPGGALGAIGLLLALRGKERNLAGELVAAMALVLLAAPAALLAGLGLSRALWMTGTWALAFGMGTLCARTILVRKKDGGRGLRAAGAIALAVAIGLGVLIGTGLVDARLAVGPMTFALVTIVLCVLPPSPKQMTRLGFGLVGASTVTLVGIVAALR